MILVYSGNRSWNSRPLHGIVPRLLYIYMLSRSLVSCTYLSFPFPFLFQSLLASPRVVDDVPPPLRPPDSRPLLVLSLHGCYDGLASRRLDRRFEGRLSLRRLGFRTPEVPNCPRTKYGGGGEVASEFYRQWILYASRSIRGHLCAWTLTAFS